MDTAVDKKDMMRHYRRMSDDCPASSSTLTTDRNMDTSPISNG